ncbi:Pol polyprotein [Plakobranchus ocellatus]|uniref:Pol polyprotein n=1 Tax=Plakobranchus ocellatus TaxID=259542 RepID=A0AAV4DS53_9GAST|nr:Pol polyprotein [Plakobranchus ocellatus]
MPLDQQSRLLTPFLTPFGRFCMNRLPFGISSAPEIFQRRMSEILRDIDGVICHMDDILIHASNQDTHDERVRTVLQRLQQAGLTLNEKCEFSKPVIKFLGHIIDGHGIRAGPQKIEAIVEFPVPTNITELQRFLGMVNQLAKFSPELASQTEPLRQLLKRDSLWSWGHPQEQSFQAVKKNLTSTPVLAHYCAGREMIIAADASNAGLETDHKPLVPLLTTKELYKMPPRIQRFRLRLMRFSPNVIHVSGKQQITADALSRAPASAPSEEDIALVNDADVMAKQTLDGLPASSRKLQDIITQQKCDPEIVEVRNFCQRGWPAFLPQNPLFRQYWVNKDTSQLSTTFYYSTIVS